MKIWSGRLWRLSLFFCPIISEFCDDRGKRIRNFVIFTTKTYGILWFSSRFPLEFCDNVLCKTASSIPSPTSWPSCSSGLWGEKGNKNPYNNGDNAIGLVTESIASSAIKGYSCIIPFSNITDKPYLSSDISFFISSLSMV